MNFSRNDNVVERNTFLPIYSDSKTLFEYRMYWAVEPGSLRILPTKWSNANFN
jgi:hypothetical protein